MTRRDFLVRAGATAAIGSAKEAPLIVPVHRTMDSRAKCTPKQLASFSSTIWPETVRDFESCGIHLQSSLETGEIRLSPAGRPIFVGAKRGVINMVITDHLPAYMDNGQALAGVTTIYQGFHLCVIALSNAHGHQIPFLSVNTCVHELLHVLLQDIFLSRPTGLQSRERELRVDTYATQLWLFRSAAAVRKSAQAYLDRVRSGQAIT